MNRLVKVLLLGLVANAVAAPGWVSASDAPISGQPAIYDESADGAKQIADALAQAKPGGKRVLLQFGANWCIWCHRLHDLLESDPALAQELKSDYVFVLVDVNKGHNEATNEKYGKPTRFGLPALVVLDSDGKQLTTKDSGELEEGKGHSPAKVLAFLKQWAPAK